MAERKERGSRNRKERSSAEVKKKDGGKVKIKMAPVKSDPVLKLLGEIMADTDQTSPTVDQDPKSSTSEDSQPGLQTRGKKRKKGTRDKRAEGTSDNVDIMELDEWHRALDAAAQSPVDAQPVPTDLGATDQGGGNAFALEQELRKKTDPEIDAALLQMLKQENKHLLGAYQQIIDLLYCIRH